MTKRATWLAVIVLAACTEPTAPIAHIAPRNAALARATIDGPTVVYSADFNTDSAGPNWSVKSLAVTPSGERFLGEFLNDTATLSLDSLPKHSRIEVTVDLYAIRSWDGGNKQWGPDHF